MLSKFRAFVIGFISSFLIVSLVFLLRFLLFPILGTSSVLHHSRAHHHAERKTNLYGPFRTVLPAGTAMPAFLRIFHERFVLSFVHINHIQRAGVFTGRAPGAEFLVDDWRHGKLLLKTDFGDLPKSWIEMTP
jgi:hypothetical protein